MLMTVVEGRRYERLVYEGGELRKRQILSVGAARPIDESSVALPIEIQTYHEGLLQDRVETRWTCRGTTDDMVMSMLAFGAPRRNVRLRADQESPGPLYPSLPSTLSSSGQLADLTFDLRIEEGALAALGGRTELRLTDRSWETLGSGDAARVRIRGKVDARSFLFGIRVRRTELESLEILDPDEGLVRHELRRAGATWSVLGLLPDSGTATPQIDEEGHR
ncbi:MAG: hypothetical protein KDD11_03455 [Acidobacteria bacterium]|nr:hypothetical protein [Acidobacteriota bacterium]